MRFADGELDADEMAVIEKAMETDDDLVARVAMFIETKAAGAGGAEAAARRAGAGEAEGGGRGHDRGEARGRCEGRRRSRRRWCRSRRARRLRGRRCGNGRCRWPLRLPRSSAGWRAIGRRTRRDRGPGGLWVAGVIRPALGEALATVRSGKEIRLAGISDRFRAIATFRNDAQDLCREFEVDFGRPFHGDVGRLPFRRRMARQLCGRGAGRRRGLCAGVLDGSARRLSRRRSRRASRCRRKKKPRRFRNAQRRKLAAYSEPME